MADSLTPERTVRILRAKGAELEAVVLNTHHGEHEGFCELDLVADVALIFLLLADHIERGL